MRFSMSTMLLIITYAAISCMSLVKPAFHWTSLVWNVSVIVLAIAAVGAFVATGRDRAYWTGFTLCGWIHYYFTLSPALYGQLNSYVFTRPALDFLCVVLKHERLVESISNSQMLGLTPSVGFFIYGNENLKTYVYFLLSGFAICSVLCGLLGGWLANYLYNTLGDAKADKATEPDKASPL